MSAGEADKASSLQDKPALSGSARLWRRVRAAWGWLGDQVAKWLRDQRRGRIVRGAIVLGFVSAAVIVGVAVVAVSQVSKHVLQYERTVRLPYVEDVLYAGEGVLYVGTATGHLVSYESLGSNEEGQALLSHPVRYVTVHGDHVFAAGEEDISRLTPSLREHITRQTKDLVGPISIAGLASGQQLGVWAIAGSRRRLVRFASDTLAPAQEITTPAPVHGLAVSARGVWSLGPNAVMLSHPRHGVWTTTKLHIPCEPRAISTEHDRAFVLCTATNNVYVLIDKSGELERIYAVARRGLGLGLDGGDLWLLSPGDDRVTGYSLDTGQQEGRPIPIGTRAAQFVVDHQAVWVGESSNALERLDKEKLVLDRAARHSATRSSFLDVPIWAWGMLAGVLVGICSMLIVFKRQADPNAGIPRYWPSRRLLVFMMNDELYEDVASGIVSRRERTRHQDGEIRHPPFPIGYRTGGGRKTSRRGYPQAMHVHETIVRLERLGLLYRGLNYVFGVPHSGRRISDAEPPSEDEFLQHFSNVATSGMLCLIAGSSWMVRDVEGDPGVVTFELPELFDRTVGETRRITIPEGARPRIRVELSSMRRIARERCVPRARVPFDVIVQALPYSEGAAPVVDLVVAWQAAPAAGRLRPRPFAKRRPRRRRGQWA